MPVVPCSSPVLYSKNPSPTALLEHVKVHNKYHYGRIIMKASLGKLESDIFDMTKDLNMEESSAYIPRVTVWISGLPKEPSETEREVIRLNQ